MRLTDLSFADWIEHAFGPAARLHGGARYFDPDCDWWDPEPAAALDLDSLACQESALHGLGHWHREHPAAVERIIDAWRRADRPCDPRLEAYACSARSGCVL